MGWMFPGAFPSTIRQEAETPRCLDLLCHFSVFLRGLWGCYGDAHVVSAKLLELHPDAMLAHKSPASCSVESNTRLSFGARAGFLAAVGLMFLRNRYLWPSIEQLR